jgi:hypothetical protein
MTMPDTLALLSIALLCGCAGAQSSSAATRPEPGCSFRAATTCWTVKGRLPRTQPKSAAPKPDDPRGRWPTIIATAVDSGRGSGR